MQSIVRRSRLKADDLLDFHPCHRNGGFGDFRQCGYGEPRRIEGKAIVVVARRGKLPAWASPIALSRSRLDAQWAIQRSKIYPNPRTSAKATRMINQVFT